MPALDFQSDQFLQLLTEALRAGPGSPEWHDAVEALRSNGRDDRDEYQLLLTARENLEKGKEYRSIRAGAGFARKLNAALDDDETSTKKSPPTAGAIAIISAGLILTAAAVLLYMLFPAGTPTAAIDKLSNTYFVDVALDAGFDSSIPRAFNRIGTLPIEAHRGLHPSNDASTTGMSSGGIVWTDAMPANQTFAIEANLRLARATDNLIAEVFVTDDPNFSENKGTSNHELLWLYQAARAKVVNAGGTVEAQSAPARDFKGILNIRIALERDAAIVSQQGKPIWSGAHGLDRSKPRYVGLRFIQTGTDKNSEAAMAFVSVKISKP
jgi:hypothetical protein